MAVFYLGHRISDDVELFLLREINLLEYTALFREAEKVERVVAESTGYCSYFYEGNVKVNFVWDKFSKDSVPLEYGIGSGLKVKLDSISNIAVNKLCALVSRFIPRDIVDLSVLFKNKVLVPEDFEHIYAAAAQREASLDDLLYVMGLFDEISAANENIVSALKPALKIELSGEDVKVVFQDLGRQLKKMCACQTMKNLLSTRNRLNFKL